MVALRFLAPAVAGVGCLVGASLSVCAVDAQELNSRLAPELRAELTAGVSSFRVIVNLVGTAATGAPLEAEPAPAERARRLAVRDRIESELAGLRPGLTVDEMASVRPFRLQPGFSATLTRTGLLTAAGRPGVLSVEPDRRFAAQTQQGLGMIGALHLHELGFTGEGAAVAIVDTGIDAQHPVLGGGAIPNAKVVRGVDTADLDDDPSDCGGHGTAVASIAAGSSYQWNPQSRFAGGVAPQAKILAYKASPDADCGSFPVSAVIAAIEDAVIHRSGDGYRLAAINLSLGGGLFEGPCDDFAPSLASAVATATEAGVTVVASTGNEGVTTAISAPACFSDVLSAASVWDTESGWVGYSFCLDPQCAHQCDDSFRPAGAVTCYGNSGTTLDLLAPSEYLRAAAAGGQTLEFGGTSGSAAYVTGALALLRQAEPGLEPGTLRWLMELSGAPTLDQRNGLIRPRLDLERAIRMVARIRPSTDPPAPISIAPATPTTSTVTIDEVAVVGSIRVLLRVDHPAPERLEAVLISPVGTRARLHDHGPGSIPASGEYPHVDGVWGLFPDELAPVDSLGVFAGEPAEGTWTLELIDSGPPDGSGTSARLVGWAVSIEPAEPPGPAIKAALVVPVAAHATGAAGATWRSAVRVFNSSPDTTSPARLYFVPSAEDGSQVFRQTELVLPQGGVLDLPDVIGSRFAAQEARGSLILETDAAEVFVTSRTFTGDPEVGTYGQYIGSAAPERTSAVGDPMLMVGEIGDGVDRRTNIGFTEISGAEAVVTVARYDGATGLAAGPPTRHRVPPFSNLQLALPATPSGVGYATVTVSEGDGRVTAYVSLVDNRSGDAVFLPASRPTPVSRLVVPVVASQPGEAGTLWRSALTIVNAGPQDAVLDLELRPRAGSLAEPASTSVSVPSGHQLAVQDVIQELFHRQQQVGLLRIEPRGGPAALVVTSRTYNDAASGTYGQLVTAVGSAVGPRAVIPHLESSDAFRTNVGLAEVTGATANLRCTIRDAIGRPLGRTLALTLEPFQLVQIDDVFRAAEATPSSNARIDLELVSGDGEFFGYASVIDQITGDAIFVPAHPLAQ
jgi:subtilisin-like proprotein convertase family protein